MAIAPGSLRKNGRERADMSDIPVLPRLGDYLRHWAACRPGQEAAVLDDLRITWGSLAKRVSAASRAMLSAGVSAGDRVAMLTPPHPEFLVAMLAATDIGAIWLGMHPRYRLPEMRHVVSDSQPRMLLAFSEIDGRGYREELEELCAAHACVERTVCIGDPCPGGQTWAEFLDAGRTVSDARLERARRAVSPEDTAVIIFTSGTTGTPKGAMIPHRALVGGGRVQSEHWPSDRMRLLQNMPPNHIAGLGMSTAQAIVTGGTVVFVDRFSPRRVLDTIERERITFFMHAPAIYHLIMSEPDFPKRDLSSMEYWLWAGSPAPADLVRRLHGLRGRTGTAFGMTELGTYATFTDADAGLEALTGSIGRPEPRYDLRLADAHGREVPAGTEGELQARGAWVMNGYYNRPDATREAYTADGWFRTGDIAVAREDGNWSLVGRLKEMFKSGGFNVYPREIEIVIEAHSAVAMAAVIGVPDPRWHEVGHAFVQVFPGAVVDTFVLDAWCRRHLANYKVPKTFEVVEELPRLPIGKIDKQALGRELARRRDEGAQGVPGARAPR